MPAILFLADNLLYCQRVQGLEVYHLYAERLLDNAVNDLSPEIFYSEINSQKDNVKPKCLDYETGIGI